MGRWGRWSKIEDTVKPSDYKDIFSELLEESEENISYDVNVMFLDGSHDNWINVKYFTETKDEISFKVFKEQWEKHVYMKDNIINYRVITNDKTNVQEEENSNNE